MTHINDFWLTEYCTDIARDIARDADNYCQALDWSHEGADGSEYVIYTAKAHAVCQNCDVTQGKELVQDLYANEFLDYNKQASLIAYGEIRYRIECALSEIFATRAGDK